MPSARIQACRSVAAVADWADVTVLVAVSGGCDSVALLRAMAAMKAGGAGRLCVAHLNHQLRPDADEDERFVVELVPPVGRGVRSGRATWTVWRRVGRRHRSRRPRGAIPISRSRPPAGSAHDSWPPPTRPTIRPKPFCTGSFAARAFAGCRAWRGSGRWVTPRSSGRCWACAARSWQAYLDALGQPYRHDPSNADLRFTRNRIRHEMHAAAARAIQSRACARPCCGWARWPARRRPWSTSWSTSCSTRCVAVEGPARCASSWRRLADRPRYLVRELLMAVWRRQGWPMQAMGRRKWDELSELAAAGDRRDARCFPAA